MQGNTAEQTQSDLYASKYQEALWTTDAALEKSRSTSLPKKGIRSPRRSPLQLDVTSIFRRTQPLIFSPHNPLLSHLLLSLNISLSLPFSLSLLLLFGIYDIISVCFALLLHHHQHLPRSPAHNHPYVRQKVIACKQAAKRLASEGRAPVRPREVAQHIYERLCCFQTTTGCVCAYVFVPYIYKLFF